MDLTDSEIESTVSSNEEEIGDSDEEILAAIRSGLIKPGETYKQDKIEKLTGKNRKKPKINNQTAIKNFNQKIIDSIGAEIIADFKEVPQLTIPKDEDRQQNAEDHANKVRSNLANDDFKREALFALEAKSACILGLELLEKHGIPTARPTDYYAEMAKSDKQMEKVKKKLVQKSEEQDRREKLRKLRDQRKKGKEIQQEIKKKRSEEKKEFLQKVKLARKNKTGDALFDDDQGRGGTKAHVNKKRQYKDKKFGYGKGVSKNMKNLANDKRRGHSGGGPGQGNRPRKASNASSGNRSKNISKKRPGKAARSKKK